VSAASSVALLRFRAGDVNLAVAAGTARSFSQPVPGLTHVGELLGIAVSSSQEGRRALSVQGLAGEAQLLVDGPVGLRSIGPRDILARPAGLPADAARLVLGFAREGEGRIIMLIDVERLIAVARERQGVRPQGEG
jgi:chemotaxis protein histidine kinase CheA